jgi:hypothetical protein
MLDVSEDNGSAVEMLSLALALPLSPPEMTDGWTEDVRIAFVEQVARVRADIHRGWGDDAEHASHHLGRVLDSWGIPASGQGRLARLAFDAQVELIQRRPPAELGD